MTTKTITIAIIVIILGLAGNRLPWAPKAFHARFPVSVKSYLKPTADKASPRMGEKNHWYPCMVVTALHRVSSPYHRG